MRLRIKRHWFKEDCARPPEQIASAIAATIWKSATHGLQGLRQAKFAVDPGAGFIAVHSEFLVFLIAAADRLAYRHDPGEWRTRFTVALATRLAEIVEENLDELLGTGSGERRRFIALVNARMDEYADFDYTDRGPDFAFQRHFGYCVEKVLSEAADRPWALDQIMSVQGPAAIEVLERGMRGLLGVDPKPRRPGAGAAARGE